MVRASLAPLERRVTEAHELWAAGGDPEFIRSQVPTVEAALRYFAPEVRHLEHLPETGAVLMVGNPEFRS